MKSTKHEKSRTQRRTVSTRHKPRARPTQKRRPRKPAAREMLGVVLAGSGWDPTALASAIAAIGSNDISSQNAMSVTGGQLVLLWLDEPQKQVRSPYASMTRPTQGASHSTIERAMPREDVIATD